MIHTNDRTNRKFNFSDLDFEDLSISVLTVRILHMFYDKLLSTYNFVLNIFFQ